MRSIRHGRPKPEYLATLRKPKKMDYEKLLQATLEALFNDNLGGKRNCDVYVVLPYVAKFPKGFPQARLIEKDGFNNIYKINARRMYDWLYEKGHTDIRFVDLSAQKREFSSLEKRIENLFEIDIDDYQETVDNGVQQQIEEEKD